MTDRLYYTDPFNRDFEATIVGLEPRDNRSVVWLDRTAFYPTSGGQPFDIGRLGGFPVVDVYEDDRGDVAHVVKTGTLTIGDRVRGEIDWPRRFDHMQQHTGQHVLSAAFDRLFGARTVGFHLGADRSTIDLDREMSPGQVAVGEDEANRIVWEDRAVTIRFVSAEEAIRLPLRKRLQPKESGPRSTAFRLIEIDDFDLSACGGTHVARTGSIGLVGIGASERFKGGQRIEFLCGGRALVRLRLLRDVTAASVRLASTSAGELPQTIERLLVESKDQRREIAALQSDLARLQADALAAGAEEARGVRLVLRAVDADAGRLKAMASAIAAQPGFMTVLVSRDTPALVVVARSADVDLSAQRIVGALTAKFGGRGGGKPDLAQGGGLGAPAEVILDEARRAILGHQPASPAPSSSPSI